VVSRYPRPGTDPVQRLRHTVAVYAGSSGSGVAVCATSGFYPAGETLNGVDGGDTGLTHHDLRRLLHLIDQATQVAASVEPAPAESVTDTKPARLNQNQLAALAAVAEGTVVRKVINGYSVMYQITTTSSATIHPKSMETLRSRGFVSWGDGQEVPVTLTDAGAKRLEVLDG
jgi:hypothetical protein